LNYIAHIHIGAHTQTNLLGNFLGDFVKGSQLIHLPCELERGVRLHRSVDVFTDSHPIIVETKQLFPRDIRRMAGVVLDIYFDYLLMNTWPKYSNTDFNTIFDEFYLQLEQFSLPNNPYFCKLAEHLVTHQWLDKYMNVETCARAFLSIESRLKNKIIFADKAQLFLQQNSEFLESRFHQFYPECLDHGVKFIQSYKYAN
jgi:acyl carrier protein phosphodiesterase